MRAFWWFKDRSIAGMARPGFNNIHWSELPLDEGILFGWLGQYSVGPAPMDSLRHHLAEYAPKVFAFFKLNAEQARTILKGLESPEGITKVFNRLAERTKSFKDISVDHDAVYFRVCEGRVREEAEVLKTHGVKKIVALTEEHHQRDFLGQHFDLHHISIKDLHAPTDEQVFELAKIISESRAQNQIMAVHCLAGIGRTSTMLMAAHMHLGESFDGLKAVITQRNPTFILAGSQGEFITRWATRGIQSGASN